MAPLYNKRALGQSRRTRGGWIPLIGKSFWHILFKLRKKVFFKKGALNEVSDPWMLHLSIIGAVGPSKHLQTNKTFRAKKTPTQEGFFLDILCIQHLERIFWPAKLKKHLGRGTQLLFFFFKALSFAFSKLGSLFIFSYIIIIYCFFSLGKVPS